MRTRSRSAPEVRPDQRHEPADGLLDAVGEDLEVGRRQLRVDVVRGGVGAVEHGLRVEPLGASDQLDPGAAADRDGVAGLAGQQRVVGGARGVEVVVRDGLLGGDQLGVGRRALRPRRPRRPARAARPAARRRAPGRGRCGRRARAARR